MATVFDLRTLAESLGDCTSNECDSITVDVSDRINDLMITYIMSPDTPFANLIQHHCSIGGYTSDHVVFRMGAIVLDPHGTPKTVDLNGAGGFLTVKWDEMADMTGLMPKRELAMHGVVFD